MEIIYEKILNFELVFPFLGVLSAFLASLILYKISFKILRVWTDKSESRMDDIILNRMKGPMRFLLPLLFLMPVVRNLHLTEYYHNAILHVLILLFIVGLAWLMVAAVSIFKSFIYQKYSISDKDNLKARSIYTQVAVIERILIVVILIVAASGMLMTFDEVKRLGMSILASAGVIGVIVGFAAQKSIGTLFAGIQIAISQPFRIDDVVIVEGEWGRIEEITLTYVVVKIWDERRLVLPITYFLEKPFQNWTRSSSQIHGTVFLYVDHTIPVQKVREELMRIAGESPLWDKRNCSLLVTDVKESTVELRALVTSVDASKNWDLRCEVREKLLAYIQKNFPESLPKIRAEVTKM